MKRNKRVLPIEVFAILTLINYFLGIWIVEINIILGASSTVEMFLIAIETGKKMLFATSVLYVVVFWCCLLYCIVTRNKKSRFIAFIILLSVDMLILICLMIYKLCVANYVSLWAFLVGVIIKIFYIMWVLKYFKMGQGTV